MSLHKYVEATAGHCAELEEELELLDLERLRRECAAAGPEGFYEMLFQHRAEILNYLRATPSERSRKAVWRDATRRRMIALAALYCARRAYGFLEAVDRFDIEPGSSYRHMTAQAGMASVSMGAEWLVLWPFDGPNPFGEDEDG